MPVVPRSVLVAPDSFKGTLGAPEVAAAIAKGIRAGGWEAEECPVGDGGEGTAAALAPALGLTRRTARARDPLAREIEAEWWFDETGGTAVVEVAAASGLSLVAERERDAEAATSAGTGDLIAAAVAAGAREVLVCAGGSATTDGGAGALGAIFEAGGLGDTKLTVLCDVRTPFELAARTFGPQKGADEEAVKRLAKRLTRLASRWPRNPRREPMTGAAGGLSGGLWAVLGARLVPGARFVLDELELPRRIREARALVVGEGRLDRQTLSGKIGAELATEARQAGVPCHAIVGTSALDDFDARILDLQTIREAGDRRALQAAGRALAKLL